METTLVYYRLGEKEEGIRLELVTEVIPMVKLDNPPADGDPRCKGLLHYRGDILPVFSLHKSNRESIADDYLMVMAESESGMALQVSEVLEIMTVSDEQIKEVSTGPDSTAEVLELEGKSLQIRSSVWDQAIDQVSTGLTKEHSPAP
jgi:chemotaxis signal transduction protein